MFLELLATVFAGVAVAGIVLAVNWLSGGRLPKGVMPIAAGLAMILFSLANEYNWFSRMQAGLPDGSAVIAQNETRALWRPWTYALPLTTRFAAVDPGRGQRTADLPDMVAVPIRLYERWKPVIEVPVLVDCAGSRRVDLVGDNLLTRDGIAAAPWVALREDDPLLRAVCPGA